MDQEELDWDKLNSLYYQLYWTGFVFLLLILLFVVVFMSCVHLFGEVFFHPEILQRKEVIIGLFVVEWLTRRY